MRQGEAKLPKLRWWASQRQTIYIKTHFTISSPPQCWFQAVVCIRTSRIYLGSGYLLPSERFFKKPKQIKPYLLLIGCFIKHTLSFLAAKLLCVDCYSTKLKSEENLICCMWFSRCKTGSYYRIHGCTISIVYKGEAWFISCLNIFLHWICMPLAFRVLLLSMYLDQIKCILSYLVRKKVHFGSMINITP